ncbi:MAG: ATP-binding protein [Myxococcota bacterium]
MIARDLEPELRRAASLYPVVTLTGPRQSGKTTLCRGAFPSHRYVSLEPPDLRGFARSDPRGFLNDLRAGAVIDEVQHVPELVSYLQEEIDERPEPGRFVLTGSEHFAITGRVAQTLAGRTAVLHLLPPSLGELKRFPHGPRTLLETLVTGSYPRIHDRGIPAARWLSDYVATYVERDVRGLLDISNLGAFTTFLGLCAGSTARELNLSRLGADAGVSHNTARAWLSVLAASFLVFLAPPWLNNPRKRLVRTPKLHFLDAGLCCHLIGITSAEQLATHPLRGAVFESWVAAEVYKWRVHRGLPPNIAHLRQVRGEEIDIVVGRATGPLAVEVKSGATIAEDWFAALRGADARLVYGGDTPQVRHGVRVVPWQQVDGENWGG